MRKFTLVIICIIKSAIAQAVVFESPDEMRIRLIIDDPVRISENRAWWKVTSLPNSNGYRALGDGENFSRWIGKSVVSEKMFSYDLSDNNSRYEIFVFKTSALDESETGSVAQNLSTCHACNVLIGVATFQLDQPDHIKLINKRVFLLQGGSWGEPPNVALKEVRGIDEMEFEVSESATNTGTMNSTNYCIRRENDIWYETYRKEEVILISPPIFTEDDAEP